jgi:hypothetical protein
MPLNNPSMLRLDNHITRFFLVGVFALIALFVYAPSAFAETCTSANPTCTTQGYKCSIAPKQSNGTCVPDYTCSSTDKTCPTGYKCSLIPKQPGKCVAETKEEVPVKDSATEKSTAATAGGGTLTNPLNAGSIPELLAIVLKGIVQLGSIVLVLMLVWVGFLFVMAQGNEEEVRSARSALMWTVIGGLVLLGAQAISMLIQSTVNAL